MMIHPPVAFVALRIWPAPAQSRNRWRDILIAGIKFSVLNIRLT